MSAELYSNGKGQYSLEQLPDFYALDEDEHRVERRNPYLFLTAGTQTSFSKASRRRAGSTWT